MDLLLEKLFGGSFDPIAAYTRLIPEQILYLKYVIKSVKTFVVDAYL